ncbi:hypothetical protein K470DRAFT_32900 [Piedraia hortae CBS 480.64]|uniref:Uncharacterized protein n=1 Tax=Piedraia hortae CBS 480.64 TaxID=1314780 RepID=A0A6A7C2L1_9PEZI|nr:hypothetical protein K470DRAFT_32900 [Piedraia hortae CBS 480.64]
MDNEATKGHQSLPSPPKGGGGGGNAMPTNSRVKQQQDVGKSTAVAPQSLNLDSGIFKPLLKRRRRVQRHVKRRLQPYGRLTFSVWQSRGRMARGAVCQMGDMQRPIAQMAARGGFDRALCVSWRWEAAFSRLFLLLSVLPSKLKPKMTGCDSAGTGVQAH